ncbi:DUF2000 domain-containing protein [Streptomyces sp. TM32]|uniref:DUF2000 domain-containing protein n=1 Tax=Streptomyces sp. TM32 TaxID=1652669 RepID=UPI00101191C0|nr:DUF2000 domain-containing protein [Streptomyces sp. TM32]RXS70312.1 DUF2000 domain-containing protein [Streptomyces sp. TM32]
MTTAPTATTAPRTAPAAPRFDTKIAVIVRDDLADWQKLNVTAFLASGIAHASDDVMGKRYEDASGNDYLPLFREPVWCFTAGARSLARTHARALSRAVPTALYTADMFTTGNDDDNRAAVRAVTTDHLDLVGLAVYGPRGIIDKITKGLKLHG